jgi:hypothetical protein
LYDKYFGEHYDEYKFDYNKIDMEHLNYNELNNKFKDTKYCVIKSRYGSGKTTFIKDLIKNKYINKRIIFLTMRQSLARNINKNFRELGFINYLDKSNDGDINSINYNHDKIIISIDSLKKITYVKFMKLKIKPYDLVICDEYCSLLSHFEYDKLNEPELLHQIFESIIRNSNKTFFLDGDISNREVLYLQKYFDYKDKPIFNINNGSQYNFTIDYDSDNYFNSIDNDLKNNKKICVVSTSSNFCLESSIIFFFAFCSSFKRITSSFIASKFSFILSSLSLLSDTILLLLLGLGVITLSFFNVSCKSVFC